MNMHAQEVSEKIWEDIEFIPQTDHEQNDGLQLKKK